MPMNWLHERNRTVPLAIGLALVPASSCTDDGDGNATTGISATTVSASATEGDTDDSMGSTSEAETESEDTMDTVSTDLSHDADLQPIWDQHCATPSCHDGTFPPTMTEGMAYASLVGQLSTQSDLDYVAPGSSEDSYLWHKVSGTQTDVGGSGADMPFTGDPLPAADIATIQEWIDGGAPE
jgi:hypothetical protein